nr:hypothetical protein [Lachnospiraceae bacterium]
MRSDEIIVGSDGSGLQEALDQAEAVAVFKGLSEKDSLHLRLLTEEMMGMLRAVTGETDAVFWIEDRQKDFRLNLRTETVMSPLKRETLLSASTSGRNQAARGIMGKLREIFEEAMEARDDDPADGFYDDWRFDAGMTAGSIPPLSYSAGWSLNQYRAHLERTRLEEWDELEKSVIANLADEVQIFIRGGTVEMVVFKAF